jgi:hypothetical protein
VLASLWDVNDERTAQFMGSFYQHLAERRPKAEALRATKLELIQRDPSSSPRQWAAFILIGEPDGRVAISKGSTYGYWLIAGVVALIFGLTAFFLMRRRTRREAEVAGGPVATSATSG